MNTRAVTIVRNNIIVHLPYSRSRNQHAGRYNCAKEHYCSFAMLAEWESTLGPLQLHETVLLRICHTRRVAKKVIFALPGASICRAARIMSPRDDISLILPHHEVPFGKNDDFRIAQRFIMPRHEDNLPHDDISLILPHHEVPCGKKDDFRIARRFMMPRHEDNIATR